MSEFSRTTGAYHIAANPKQYQPQLNHCFKFIFPEFSDPLLVAGGNEGVAEDYMDGRTVKEYLEVSCKSSTVPHFTTSPVKVDRGNSYLNFAGAITSWDTLTIQIYDYIGTNTKEALMAWQNMSANVTEDTIGSMDVIEYKRDCYLQEYTPDWRLVRQWKIYGAFITKISEGGKDYSQKNSVNTVTVTIVYDRAEVDRNAALGVQSTVMLTDN